MLNKKRYFEQVEEIRLSKNNIDVSNFELLFDIATRKVNKKGAEKVADDILEDLFNMPVTKNILIPLSFYESEVGKAILIVKFDIAPSEVYFIVDVVEMTGFSSQYIQQEAIRGNIVGQRKGKIWVFQWKDVENYMKKKQSKINQTTNNVQYEVKEEKHIAGFDREEEYK